MALGQRLSWHLNLVNKALSLPQLPDSHEFYLRAINTSLKKNLKGEQALLHQMISTEGLSYPQCGLKQTVYTQDSNTVFYYSDYKVLLLLDFSKSTSTIYPYQEKSYLEKMQESIEIFIHNLWFKLNNRYAKKKEAGSLNPQGLGFQRQKSLKHKKVSEKNVMADVSKGSYHINDSPIHEVTEDQDEYSPNVPKELSAEVINTQDSGQRTRKGSKGGLGQTHLIPEPTGSPSEYIPVIHLSIVASGLPPNSNMKILIHNQRLDDKNRNEVLRSLRKRLEMIEDQLVEGYQEEQPTSREIDGVILKEDYLQTHLCNANRILSLMSTGAKPLLVIMTDATTSLMGKEGKKSFDNIIRTLHANDTKIITVDLCDENRVANTFGYVNHDEHLKYLAYVTFGAHFDFQTLIKLAGKFSQNYMGNHQVPALSNSASFMSKFPQHDSLKLMSQAMNMNQKNLSLGLQHACSEFKLNNLAEIKTSSKAKMKNQIGSLPKTQFLGNFKGLEQDLSENDQFHDQLNSLQKLMFARPCSYSSFLEISEIQQLVNYQERLIFDNRVSSELVRKLRKDKNLHVNPSFSVKELLLNNRYMPIFRKEQLSEYLLTRITQASKICEYRSRMQFQFRKMKVTSDHKQDSIYPLPDGSSPLDLPGSKIYYQYWWNNQILILCSIEKIVTPLLKHQVHVTYKLVAQEEVIDQIKRDRKTLNSKNKLAMNPEQTNDGVSLTLLEQLTKFLTEIQKCDQLFEIFQAIERDIERTYKIIHNQQITNRSKFCQKQHSFSSGLIHQEKTQHSVHELSEKQGSKPTSRIGSRVNSNERMSHDETIHQGESTKSKRKIKHQKKTSNVPEGIDTELKKEVTFKKSIAITEDHALRILKRHHNQWNQLVKIPVSLWQQLFIYSRLDISASSKIGFYNDDAIDKFDSFINTDDIIKQRESQISQIMFIKIKEFTTFTLNDNTFVQVFKDKNSSTSLLGFCIIKVQWAAINIAVIHLGFYNVSPKSQLQFESSFHSFIEKDSSNQIHINQNVIQNNKNNQTFTVHNKQVASLLVTSFPIQNSITNNDEDEDQSNQIINKQQFETTLYDASQNRKQSHFYRADKQNKKDIFYSKEWIWNNENALTNRDFFDSIARQRLKEGFIFVNSFFQHVCSNHFQTYTFIKIIKAYKQKRGKLIIKQNQRLDNFEQISADVEETEIVIQYVIKFEKTNVEHEHPHEHHGHYSASSSNPDESKHAHIHKHLHLSFRSELFMDHESAYFYVEKNHNQGNFRDSANLSQDQNALRRPDDQKIDCLSDKNFFHELSEYVFGVDKFLFNNICTYHNIVKNSVKKVIEPNPIAENGPIKSEVCFFKNIFNTDDEGIPRSIKARKRLKLEYAIRSKMQLLKSDWMEFLKCSYPELYSHELASEEEESKEVKEVYVHEHVHSQKYHSRRIVVNDSTFLLQIQELLESSKLLFKEELRIPEYLFNERPENFKDLLSQFYDQIMKVYEDFSDFKILKFQDEPINQGDKYIYYAKLVSKQILFLIKIPTKQEFTNAVMSHRGLEGSLEVEYYRLTKKMIKISKKLSKSRILYLLNPEYRLKHQQQQESFRLSENLDTEEVLEDEIDEDDDENINQIDQICDFIFYYEQSLIDGNKQLQFESNVNTIINNFCQYLKSNYDIIFASTVLMNIPDELTTKASINQSQEHTIINEASSSSNDHLKNDFKRIKETMSRCRFRLDISFLCQLFNQLQASGCRQMDESSELYSHFKITIDEIFHDIIWRNFRLFETDSEYFVFKKNAEYDDHSTPKKERSIETKSNMFDSLRLVPTNDNNHSSNDTYLMNLEGTKDSYSDSEEQTDNRRIKPNIVSQLAGGQTDKLATYSSCKKLLFKVDLIIKNVKGEVVSEKKLEKLSEIFDPKNRDNIAQVCQELSLKAKQIIEERRAEASQTQNQQKYDQQILENYINEQTLFPTNKNNESAHDIDHKETKSSVEIYLSFYTIPQYIGLVKDQDVDFLQIDHQEEILVNDDDYEDLIRVSKINESLLENHPDKIKRLEFEDLSVYKNNQWSLSRPFNKKQLVRSIPYYFKSGFRLPKDYRVYYYDEIQRKIIYGILRRTYALVAECFIEYLSMVTKGIDPLNIIILQKYMGALLNKQRKTKSLKLLHSLGSRLPNAQKILSEDLKRSNILNVTGVKLSGDNSSHDEIFIVRSQPRLRNFFLKQQINDEQQVEFMKLDSESETNSPIEGTVIQRAYCTSIHDLEKIEVEQTKIDHEPFDIPFWILFRINVTDEGKNMPQNLSIEYVYSLPGYKTHYYLDQKIVEKELIRCFDLISKRVQTILLLNQVEQRKAIPASLVLNDLDDYRKTHSTFSQATQNQIQDRMQKAKIRMNESMVPDSLPLAKLQHQQSASHMTINTTSQTKAQTQQYTSKIGRRFGKYNKTMNKDENEIGTVLGDTITINATSTVYSEQTLKESDTSTQKTGSPQKIQQVHEVFKVNKVFEYLFPIYHSALKTEDGIWAIAEKTFPNQEIDGHKDLFVNSQENVFLYKLSSQSNSSQEVKSSMLKSSSNVQTFFNHPVSGDQEEESSFIGHPSIFRKGHHTHINSIKIEIYGACFPKKSHVGALIQMIESSLQQITIVKLAGQLIFHKGYITKEDHNYIEGADQKLFVAFPLDDSGITDQFGLLKYLKQNLQRVLNPVTQGSHPIKSRGPLGATILGQTQSNETADLGNRNIRTQSILSGHSNRVDDSQRVRQNTHSNKSSFYGQNRHDDEDILIERVQTRSFVNIDFQEEPKTIIKESSCAKDDQKQLLMPESLTQIQINLDEFTLLYNYQKVVQTKKKEKSKEILSVTFNDFFGKAIALSKIQVLKDFGYQLFEESAKKGQSPSFINHIQTSFPLNGNESENKNSSLKSQGDLTKKDSQKINYSMPLIYYQQKLVQEGKEHIAMTMLNDQIQVPRPKNLNSAKNWILFNTSILGTLNSDMFVKNLILNVNQAITESITEAFIMSQFTPRMGLSVKNLQPGISLTGGDEIKEDHNQKKQDAISPSICSISKQIGNLGGLISQGQLCYTDMITEQENLIYGDSSDILNTIVSAMIVNFHQEFKIFNFSSLSTDISEGNQALTISLIIELINQNNQKLEKTLLYSFGDNLFEEIIKELHMDLKLHLAKTKTILRNIHPQFKIMVGSFAIVPSKELIDNRAIIFKDFRYLQDKFRGLRPDPIDNMQISQLKSQLKEVTPFESPLQDNLDSLSQFKIYSNLESKIKFGSNNEFEAKIGHPRNFFFMIGIQDQKLKQQSFNLDKKVLKLCKDLVYNHLLWNCNRQNFFKRIITQKLGTVYTLKDFYTSTHIINDQAINPILSAQGFTYNKPATLIEGTPMYDFKKILRKQKRHRPAKKQLHEQQAILQSNRKKKRIATQPDNREPEEGKIINGLQTGLMAEEYLKRVKQVPGQDEDFDTLQLLYKTLNKQQALEAKKAKLSEDKKDNLKKPNQEQLVRVQSPNNQSKVAPENVNFSINEITLKKKGQKLAVPFEDFIQNKAIQKVWQTKQKEQNLQLTNMLIISPCLQPSRANIILAENEKYQKSEVIALSQKHKESFNEQLIQSQESKSKILVTNPLFFHGMKMIAMLKCYFQRVKQSQKLAAIYNECDKLVQRKFMAEKLQMEQQEKFRELIARIQTSNQAKHHIKIGDVEKLIRKSRLLYSNITQQLFVFGSYHNEINDDDELFSGIPQAHTTTFIGPAHFGNTCQIKQQSEEFRKDLLNEYNHFLLQKLGVKGSICFMFTDKLTDNQQQRSMTKIIPSNQSHLTIKQKKIKIFLPEDDQDSTDLKPLKKSRKNKNSEDLNDSDRIGLLKNNQGGSSSSLHFSSQNQDSQYLLSANPKRKQERVLLQNINEEDQEYQLKLYSYIVKTLFDDSLVIYELLYLNGLIRINVYKYDSMIKTFPRNIFSDYNIYFAEKDSSIIKRDLVVKEIHNLSTRLNTDSFNYDFHLKEICNQIFVKRKKEFNISQQIQNVISYYKKPPKFSKNYIDVVVLRIDLGFMKDISESDFLQYFCSQYKQYGFQVLSQPSNAFGMANKMKPSQSVIEVYRSDNDDHQDAVKFAFYKEEGYKARIDNFESQQQILRRNKSFISTNNHINKMQGTHQDLEQVEEKDEDSDQSQNKKHKLNRTSQNISRGNSQPSMMSVRPKKQQSSFLQSHQTQQQPPEDIKQKLFYVEHRNKLVHPDPDNDQDIFRQIWNVECRKQETTYSQIGNEEEKTVLDLVFYMIYTTPMTSNQIDENGQPKDKKLNNERYPIREVSQDMSEFISSLKNAFSECRKELIKDQLWTRFFDQTKKAPLTEAEIHDMLKFSYSFDIRSLDERYKELLNFNLYHKKLSDHIKIKFERRWQEVTNNLQVAAQVGNDPSILRDLLIFDPEIPNFVIHLEFNMNSKSLNCFLVKKDFSNAGKIDAEDDTTNKYKPKAIQTLQPFEGVLIKRIVNNITYFLWKKAMSN